METRKITDEELQRWIEKMEKYNRKEKTMMEYPKRGDIWTLDFGLGVGSEIRGVRPVVILSSSLTNEKTNTLLVLPITKRSGSESCEGNVPGESEFKYHLPLKNELFKWGADKVDGIIKTETIYTKSRGRIGKRIGRLNDDGIDQVTELVNKVLHIREPISPDDDLEKMKEKEQRRKEKRHQRFEKEER